MSARAGPVPLTREEDEEVDRQKVINLSSLIINNVNVVKQHTIEQVLEVALSDLKNTEQLIKTGMFRYEILQTIDFISKIITDFGDDFTPRPETLGPGPTTRDQFTENARRLTVLFKQKYETNFRALTPWQKYQIATVLYVSQKLVERVYPSRMTIVRDAVNLACNDLGSKFLLSGMVKETIFKTVDSLLLLVGNEYKTRPLPLIMSDTNWTKCTRELEGLKERLYPEEISAEEEPLDAMGSQLVASIMRALYE
ncbi:hypothetical protein T484DRAFT_1758548 [Baffinella frigidus]|nr:hypothetical protein T484DRAFT_1758548 [Cryptophyta sp. CCMP2293]